MTIAIVGLFCFVAGIVASFVFYSPEKRVLTRLEQIILAEEQMVVNAGSSIDKSWLAGATHAVNLFKSHLPRFAHSKT